MNESSCHTQDALAMLAYAAESELEQDVVRPAFTKYIDNGTESDKPGDTLIRKNVTGRLDTIPNGSNMVEIDDVHQTRNDIVSTLSHRVCLLM